MQNLFLNVTLLILVFIYCVTIPIINTAAWAESGLKVITGKTARFTSAHHWWGHSWSSDSSSGPPSTGERWTYCKESSKGPLKWLSAWSIFHMNKDQEWVQRGWNWVLYSGAQCQEKRQWPQPETQEVPAEHQEMLVMRVPKKQHG